MTIAELMTDGLNLLAVGMGTVFVFLTVLVVSVMTMSRLSGWLEALWPQPPAAAIPAETVAAKGIPADHIAALAAALHRHRARRRAQ